MNHMFILQFLKHFMIKILYSKLKEKPQSTEDIFNKSKQCNKNKQLKIVKGFTQFTDLKAKWLITIF